MRIDKVSNGRNLGQNGSQMRVRASIEELAHNQVNVRLLRGAIMSVFLSFYFLTVAVDRFKPGMI